MSKDFTILVGTIGNGMWRSADGGDSWTRPRYNRIPEMEVWELVVHPREPNIVYTGTDDGVYRSEDRGNSWEKLDSPMDSLHTWTLAIDPVEPDTIFAGTRPSAVFRSQDGGQRWEKLSMELAEECRDVVIPRVSVLKVDPENHRNIWAGIEVDGVRRSLDGGDTWTTIGSGLDDPDIHDIALSGGQPNTIFATTPKEIFASANGGESWLALEVMKQFSHAYIRPIRLKEDNPQVIFVGHGNNRPPTTGSIERSTDGGNTWESLPLPVEPNSYILCIATHPSDPNLVIATSRFGELYRSFDGGDSWQKLRQEFSEVRGLAWTPN